MKWTLLDKIIAYFRISRAIREIPLNCTICDIGCSNGLLLKKMTKKIKMGYGLDNDICIKKEGNLVFKKIDLEKQSIKIGTKVDAAIMLAVLEHMNNPERVLKNIYNILSKNGKFIMTTPSKKAEPILEALAYLNLVNPKIIRDHKSYYAQDELFNFLSNAGFKNIKIKEFELGFNLIATANK